MALLGDDSRVPQITASLLKKEEREGFYLESLQLTINRYETVPAYFAYPKGVKQAPLVLFSHSHGGDFTVGKEEVLCGSSYLQQPSFLTTLIAMGYAVGVIDMWGFGERQGKKESELVKEFLVTGKTLWGMRLFDNLGFLDYLLTRSEIDPQRIGALGMSMGGLMSWWLSALDSRIKVCCDIAGQVELEALIAQRGLDHHGFYYYVPKLLKETSTLAIQELICPRARISLVGKDDRMCPLSGVTFLNEKLTARYRSMAAADRFESHAVTGGHQETKEMRYLWQTFLRKHL